MRPPGTSVAHGGFERWPRREVPTWCDKRLKGVSLRLVALAKVEGYLCVQVFYFILSEGEAGTHLHSLGIPSAGMMDFNARSWSRPSFFMIFHVRGHIPMPAPISLSSLAAS